MGLLLEFLAHLLVALLGVLGGLFLEFVDCGFLLPDYFLAGLYLYSDLFVLVLYIILPGFLQLLLQFLGNPPKLVILIPQLLILPAQLLNLPLQVPNIPPGSKIKFIQPLNFNLKLPIIISLFHIVGCQAEAIFQHSIFVLQGPNLLDFVVEHHV